jgi:hypothetical protein
MVGICVGSDGHGNDYVHAVYGEDPVRGPNSGYVWYVRSGDGGATWTAPVDIKGYSGLDRPAPCDICADSSSDVYVVYGPEWDTYPRVHFCWSINSGTSWNWKALNTTDQSGAATVLCDDSSGVYIFYNTDQGYIGYQYSTNKCGTWSSIVQVAPRYSTWENYPRIPVGWVDPSKTSFHIIFSDYVSDTNHDYEIYYVQMLTNGAVLVPRYLQSVLAPECNHWDFGRSLIVYDEGTILVGCSQRFQWDFPLVDPQFAEPYVMLISGLLPASVGDRPHSETVPLGRLAPWPNPTSRTASIQYSLSRDQHVTVEVYDATGKLVRTLVESVHNQGTHTATWDGKNDAGEPVAQGVYIVQVNAGESPSIHKVVISR